MLVIFLVLVSTRRPVRSGRSWTTRRCHGASISIDQMEDVSVGLADSRGVFRVYKAGREGPLLVLLHGGGHSALSWAVFTVSVRTEMTLDGLV